MFFLIPLMLILGSAAGISVIVLRKVPYLKKLTPETGIEGNVWDDFFPEFSRTLKSVKLKEYKAAWLVELEKLLRKLRVFSLKMDRISESWIKKVRNGHGRHFAALPVVEKTEIAEETAVKAQIPVKTTMEDMKKKEKPLINEIAKNPKDSKLYEVLGDLYIKMNNLSDAKESFEAAIELNPDNGELQKKRSQTVEKMVISQ